MLLKNIWTDNWLFRRLCDVVMRVQALQAIVSDFLSFF